MGPKRVGSASAKAGTIGTARIAVTATVSTKGAAKGGRDLAIAVRSALEVSCENKESGGPVTPTGLMRGADGAGVLARGREGARGEDGGASRGLTIRPSVMAAIATITVAKKSLTAVKARITNDAAAGETAVLRARASAKRGQRFGLPVIAAKRSATGSQQGTTGGRGGLASEQQAMPFSPAIMAAVKVTTALFSVGLEVFGRSATVSRSQRIQVGKGGQAVKVMQDSATRKSSLAATVKVPILISERDYPIRSVLLTAWFGGSFSRGRAGVLGGQR